jgi:hypothetical protein
MNTPIKGIKADGSVVWFTGRAGDNFVSAKRADAFTGFNVEGARRKATTLNRGTVLHGIRFVAVSPDVEAA